MCATKHAKSTPKPRSNHSLNNEKGPLHPERPLLFARSTRNLAKHAREQTRHQNDRQPPAGRAMQEGNRKTANEPDDSPVVTFQQVLVGLPADEQRCSNAPTGSMTLPVNPSTVSRMSVSAKIDQKPSGRTSDQNIVTQQAGQSRSGMRRPPKIKADDVVRDQPKLADAPGSRHLQQGNRAGDSRDQDQARRTGTRSAAPAGIDLETRTAGSGTQASARLQGQGLLPEHDREDHQTRQQRHAGIGERRSSARCEPSPIFRGCTSRR